ncbi:hypothetical protein SAMN05660845_2243 [Flavobacterium swingsii]|uniref:DUF6438 domain-containing protein n=1 Tax=Flavobacterium swingsii TaxID=498292 RepID=A0A1I0ZF58_9FLAO|nr:DUF6438 domain-containing protein [Flavobacterium swingsii]SFB24255.1 hypothetical protein SAMN05660845_2243 [Flavobacterium swingsii]
MKYLQTLLLLVFFVSCNQNEKFVKAKIKLSEIDSLKTEAEIEKYIGEKDTLYKIFELKNIQSIKSNDFAEFDSLNKILANKVNVEYSYVKADFDNNGYTDLLAIGDNNTNDGESPNVNIEIPFTKDFNTIVLMNFSTKKTKLYDLDKDLFFPIVPKVEYVNSQPFIIVYKQKTKPFCGLKGKEESKSKLTFKYDGFVEYHPEEKSYDIEKIEFFMSPCMGQCPLYNFEINSDRTAKFTDELLYRTKKWKSIKHLKATISEKEYNELISLLNYIDFEKLNDNYNVNWTDDRSSILKITYNNGEVKTIEDYGLLGTYGLQRVYEMLVKLRTNQNWK